MSLSRFNRRTLMKLAGVGAAAATGLLGGRAERALAGGAVPPRFLLLYGGGGWTPRATFMRPSFSEPTWGHWSDILRIANGRELPNTTPERSEFDFSFTDARMTRADMSRVLDPFWEVRSKLMAFEGLAMLSTGWDRFGDAHAQNHLAAATGGPGAYAYDGVKSHALLPSLDQRVLAHVKTTDPTAISLDFNPNVGRYSGTSGFHYFLYSQNAMGGTDRLPTEGDPEVVAARLFGGPDPDTADMERRALAQRAMFAQLQRHYGDLASRTSGLDRSRLEAHRMLLSELDARLAAPRPTCEGPLVSPVGGLDRAAAYESDWNAFADIMVAGFACGLSRVGSISLKDIPPEAYGLPPETDIHHDYEHNSDPLSYYTEEGGMVAAEEGMIQRQLFQARLVARLVQRMDQIPDLGGGTVLDNTIVLYVSELANGNHGSEYCPFLVFGGGAIGLRTGRYLKYPQDLPNPWSRNYFNEHTGTPHSRLYIGLLQRLGLDVEYLHEPSIVGTVPHLTDTEETVIDMSTPLPRLT